MWETPRWKCQITSLSLLSFISYKNNQSHKQPFLNLIEKKQHRPMILRSTRLDWMSCLTLFGLIMSTSWNQCNTPFFLNLCFLFELYPYQFNGFQRSEWIFCWESKNHGYKKSLPERSYGKLILKKVTFSKRLDSTLTQNISERS